MRDRFGAGSQTVSRVSAWARSAGFTVNGLDSTGSRLTLTATARTARVAFGVGLVMQRIGGVQVRVATGTPRPPAAVAADIRAVSGLSEHVATPLRVKPGAPAVAGPSTTAAGDGPYCATYWGEWNKQSVPQKYPAGYQSNELCGYNGAQLRALYGLSAADRGQGQTIAIVGAYHSATTLTDANTAAVRNGVPPLRPDQLVVKQYPIPAGDGSGCDQDTWHAEEALDVQAAHTTAPDARLVYVAAPDCTRLEDALAAAVDDSSLGATVVSNSWGILGAEPADTQYLTATNNVLARAAVLGIGTYFGSGDSGDNSTLPGAQGPSVTFPSSSPWTTAVGGTSSAVGVGNRVLWQTGWEDAGNTLSGGSWTRLNPPLLAGAGGGASQRFDKPTWQSNLAGSKRMVPDIAALADPYTGFFVGYTTSGGQYIGTPLGGTSLASPIVASLVAVAQGRAGADSDVGLLAPVLYAKAGSGSGVVADVQHVAAGVWAPSVGAGNPRGDYLVDLDAGVQTLKTGSGWDPVTGLGTPGPGFLTGIVS
nr:S53 family peptidase [Planosporangium mesophilum]